MKKKYVSLFLLLENGGNTVDFYISQKNNQFGDGTKENPFQTISQAAEIAMPGDTIIIDDGIYREWVNPRNGGFGNNQRITYKNAEGAHPVISGAEIISDWELYENNVWYTKVNNAIFNGYNPYTTEIYGDWYDEMGQTHHIGELFVDGTAMYEAASFEAILKEAESEEKKLRWYAVQENDTTIFYGDFGGENPNECCTEISVRPYCFFPEREGLNYITVSGLEMCMTATQWAPPTAFQEGTIGPHWSKGWVIENCKIHDSKCCGISLGKKREVNDNIWTKNPAKGGAQTYSEIIFANINNGWDKEHIGSHIVRNNEIYNCGQTGIVGCMGAVFSDIIGNHIHHINIRNEFSGCEMAGIKLHAPIDVVIEKNIIHDCSMGLWLDWEAQGTVVRKNIMFENQECCDMLIEVCHGPCMVENNLFLSDVNLWDVSQGTACVHNLFAGKITASPETNRFTMYHLPHSTMVGGVILIYGGDDRILNNFFIAQEKDNEHRGTYGTTCYEKYRHEAYKKSLITDDPNVQSDTPMFDVGRTLPVVMQDNAYFNGAQNWEHEKNPRIISDFHAEVSVTEEDGHYWLDTNLGEFLGNLTAEQVTTAILGKAFEPDQAFENRDGSPLAVDSDLMNYPRGEKVKIGPFETGVSRIMIV